MLRYQKWEKKFAVVEQKVLILDHFLKCALSPSVVVQNGRFLLVVIEKCLL